MLNSRATSVSLPVFFEWAYTYRFEWDDGKCVGEKVTNQPVVAAGVVVPSSVAYWVPRSPLIHTSTRSMPLGPKPGSVAVPLTVKSFLVETSSFGKGFSMTSCGGA